VYTRIDTKVYRANGNHVLSKNLTEWRQIQTRPLLNCPPGILDKCAPYKYSQWIERNRKCSTSLTYLKQCSVTHMVSTFRISTPVKIVGFSVYSILFIQIQFTIHNRVQTGPVAQLGVWYWIAYQTTLCGLYARLPTISTWSPNCGACKMHWTNNFQAFAGRLVQKVYDFVINKKINVLYRVEKKYIKLDGQKTMNIR